jgi:hypothetical protein
MVLPKVVELSYLFITFVLSSKLSQSNLLSKSLRATMDSMSANSPITPTISFPFTDANRFPA